MAITHIGSWNLTTASSWFKDKYGDASFDIYDAKTAVMSQMNKTFDHSGTNFKDAIPLSLGGGVSAGSLGTASQMKVVQVSFARKKMYYRARIDREAIYASQDQGAFVEGLKLLAGRAPLIFSRWIETQLFLPKRTVSSALTGSGDLGTIDTSGVSGTNPYTLTFTAATFKESNFEIGDIVYIDTVGGGDTDEFEVQNVIPGSLQITVERSASDSQVPADADHVFMQKAEDNGLISIPGLTSLASGETAYGVTHGYRWEPGANVNASSAGLTVELLDEAAMDIDTKTGRGPNLVVTPHVQWRKLSAQMEDQKEYPMLPPRNKIEGHPGFPSITYIGPTGPAPVITSRFAKTDEVYLLNMDMMEMKHSQGFGWFDDDGTIFLREANSDSYEARFGGYQELYAPPTFHGRIHTLAT